MISIAWSIDKILAFRGVRTVIRGLSHTSACCRVASSYEQRFGFSRSGTCRGLYKRIRFADCHQLEAGDANGILAAVFHAGGGSLTVPVPFDVFVVMGVPGVVRMPLAVGTSIAIIIPMSIKSCHCRNAHWAVDDLSLKAWAILLVAGVLIGAIIARCNSPDP